MKALLLLIALAMPMLAHAQYQPETIQTPETQTDDEAVRATIAALFDAMRASDSEAVGAVFHDNATLQSVMPTQSGTFQMQSGEISGFVASIGGAPEGALDEKVGEITVELDAGLAHAWMDYSFYYQGQRSHCGVNSIQLVKTDGGDWKILNVVDTRRRDCDDAP